MKHERKRVMEADLVVAEIVAIHKGRIQAINDNGLLIKIYLPIVNVKEIIK